MGKFWKVECFWERVANLPTSRGTEGFTDKSFSARCKKSQTNGDGGVGHLILRELWTKGYSWYQKPVSGELGDRAWAEPYILSRSISASFPAEWENQQTWATVGESCVVGSISCVNGKVIIDLHDCLEKETRSKICVAVLFIDSHCLLNESRLLDAEGKTCS